MAGKQVSANEAAKILGYRRHTLVDWATRHGCPAVQRPGEDSDRWIFDTADVVAWLQQRAADHASAKVATESAGDISKAEAERRQAVARAQLAEIDLDERRGEVVPVQHVAAVVRDELAKVRTKLHTIPSKVAARVDEITTAASARDLIQAEINDVLSELRADAREWGTDGEGAGESGG